MLKNILLDETPFSDRHAEDSEVHFVITYNRQLHAWGRHLYGKLGLGSITMSKEPKLINGLENEKFAGIKICGNIVLARTIDGKLYVWGGDRLGPLGHHGYLGIGNRIANTPQLIQTFVDLGLQCIDACQIGSGSNFMALCKNELDETSVHVWGKNPGGKLGLENEDPHPFPTLLPLKEKPKQILSFLDCNFILTAEGNVYVFGYDNLYDLAPGVLQGNHGYIRTPTMLTTLQNKKIEKLYLTRLPIIARTADGCFMWGNISNQFPSFKKDVRYIHKECGQMYCIHSNDEISIQEVGMQEIDLPPMKIAAIQLFPQAAMIISVEGQVFFYGDLKLDNRKFNYETFTDITHLTGRVTGIISGTRFIQTDQGKTYYLELSYWPTCITSKLPANDFLPSYKELWEPGSPPSLGEPLYKKKLADQFTDLSFYRGNKQRLWQLYTNQKSVDVPAHEEHHLHYR